MDRFFVDGAIDSQVELNGAEHLHLTTVLRAKVQDTVVLSNGDGLDYVGQIKKIEKSKTAIDIIKTIKNNCVPSVNIDLFCGALKSNDKMEWVVQKSVELGASTINPFLSRYTVAKSSNTDRLNKISKEASKQCGRADLAKVRDLISFDKLLHQLISYDLVLWVYEKATIDIQAYINDVVLPKQIKNLKKMAIVVGAEGGFSLEEVTALSQITTPISLGNRILRAEMASIGVLTICCYCLGEFKNRQ